MKFKIWDKKEEINGVSSSDVLESCPDFRHGEIFLVLDDGGRVTHIEKTEIIKSNLCLDWGMSTEEVAEHYIKTLEYQMKDNDVITLDSRIGSLEDENAGLLFEVMEKDIKIDQLENDLADILLNLGGM